MEYTKFKNEVECINSLKKNIKYLICAVTFLFVIVAGLVTLIIAQQLSIGLVTIDTFIGIGVALIAGLATIIVANHFISIFNFNNKISDIEKEVDSIRVLKRYMIHAQVNNNNNLAHNTFLEGKFLKTIIIELNNMSYLIKNRNYFDEDDKDFKRKLDAKIGYIANDFACFIEDRKYDHPTFDIEDVVLEIKTAYFQVQNIDSQCIKIKLDIIYNIIICGLENIISKEFPIIPDKDMENLQHMRKR